MKFNKLDDSKRGRIRPRFKLESPETKETILSLINRTSDKDITIDCLQQQKRFMRISIPTEEQHYWSPVLKLTCNDTEVEGKTIIRGHIGPNESVWGIFFLTYAAIAVLGFFGGIWAYAQYLFKQETIYLWIFPIAIVVLLTMFITSKIGQNKAHMQTLHLMRFLRKSIDPIECNRIT